MANVLTVYQENSADAVHTRLPFCPNLFSCLSEKRPLQTCHAKNKALLSKASWIFICHIFVLRNTSVITGLCSYHSVTSVQAISALWALSVLVVVGFFSPSTAFSTGFLMTVSLHHHNQLSRTENVDLWADSRTIVLIRHTVLCHLEKAEQAGTHLKINIITCLWLIL